VSDRNRLPAAFRPGRNKSRGQALVEFSLVLIPFVMLLMGVFDIGRAIYALNATAEAARDIARVTAVHPCNGACGDLGSSTEAQAVIATQQGTVPNLVFAPSTDVDCVEVVPGTPPTENVMPDDDCSAGSENFIRVHVRSAFAPITPIVAIFGTHNLDAWARVQLP
jgi:Flp pilus assembly protein TadG